MFGRNKAQQATTKPANDTSTATNTKKCNHEIYSGYREGDFLVCSCHDCDHWWTRRVAG
ncbi:hypothetical protein [Saccharothrix sp.]|uniref:hypothetical protein n=1 Tax=Saccharothrix sp. TaxID=1873460 RepID=UPI002811B527|nr:hypothetical protein [Saccharothrix sp.]